MIRVTRVSMLSGKEHTMELPISETRFTAWDNAPKRERPFVQVAFPELDKAQREFLLTGSTDEEWKAAFGEASEEHDPDCQGDEQCCMEVVGVAGDMVELAFVDPPRGGVGDDKVLPDDGNEER